MLEWFAQPDPATILMRLIAALVFGGAVAWIHERTTPSSELGATFAATLVLLAVLIAMVTQVIGDNVARAFSLVGALSIVRFRTVVRDTRDTAFVIFAVVVGMACGAQNLFVAFFGLVVCGSAAFVLSARQNGHAKAASAAGGPISWKPEYQLRVRAAMAIDMEKGIGPAVAAGARLARLSSISTGKQGTAIEATWDIVLAAGGSPESLMREIGRIDGVQEVRVVRSESEET